ncbi:enamine deaminase RidA (YjgF/YER057c/UK114 family) [Mesorhizobium robiniae]|uniref:Enamine deaminase RidA (YjgF/YER057c/UK114 family) n=1 Tax=Mesorhizobium robiniae TaxID=559315 RepID=A0ABV2H005_9HYPH|nr:RidA family protein [Mesorhizobium sp. ZC-5]MCV3244126.1 RidA family protein [Mesorhizobium sp. ZC-5]
MTGTNQIQRLQTNARMSHVVIAAGIVYLSGQVADTPNAPIKQQVKEALSRIDTLLGSAGVDNTRLLTANVWLSDALYFEEFNRVWEAWVPDYHAPTRATVQALLMGNGYDVEIAVTALAR